MERKYYLFCYDVVSPSLSRKTLKMARRYALREQKSCFECFMSEEELQEMQDWIKKNFTKEDKAGIFEIHGIKDSFRFGDGSDKDPFIFV